MNRWNKKLTVKARVHDAIYKLTSVLVKSRRIGVCAGSRVHTAAQ